MASQNPAPKGVAYVLEFPLFDSNGAYATGLTLQAADVQIAKDGAAFANLTNTPVEIGTASGWYGATLTAAEMGADRICIRIADASGSAFTSYGIWILTVASGKRFDDLATAAAVTDVDTVVDAIKAVTDELPNAGQLTALGNLDAAVSTRATPGDLSGLSTFDAGSDTVTVGTNNDKTGYALSASGVQAIWDVLTSALTTAGSIGKLLVDNINATIGSRSTFDHTQDNVTVGDIVAAALARFFTRDSGSTYAEAVAGSVVKEGADNAQATIGESGIDDIATAVVAGIGTGQITVVGPVAVGGDVTIIRGDDYKAADSRALQWSSDSWPDLTDAQSITFATSRVTASGSVVSAGGATQSIRVELEGDDTDDWRTGSHAFDITAILSNGNEITLVQATMTVLREY